MGSSSVMGKKPQILHGPNAHKDDFKPQPNPMQEEEMDAMKKTMKSRKPGETTGGDWLHESTTLKIDSALNIENTDKVQEYLDYRKHKQKYNDELKKSRKEREL